MDEEMVRKEFENWAREQFGSVIHSVVYSRMREAWLEATRRADKRAREECAAIVATLAERPYDNDPEFSALLHAESVIRATITEE